jgi:hypothetical protein
MAKKRNTPSCPKDAKAICSAKDMGCRAFGAPVGTSVGDKIKNPKGKRVLIEYVSNKSTVGQAGKNKIASYCYELTPRQERFQRAGKWCAAKLKAKNDWNIKNQAQCVKSMMAK